MTPDSKTGTILVVDDNLHIRAFARTFLETAGYTVVTAADGEEALHFYAEHQSSIVLLLTDVVMPNLDGLKLADRVLEMDSRLPVLFMSGDSWSADRGFGCVAKPFQPAELVERVGRALNTKSRQERSASAA
jgi:CheY-like chemotaxis protein